MNYKTLTLTLLLGLATHTGLQAEEMMNHAGHDMGQMSQMEGMNEMAMTQGVISRIDAANGKVGIKHEAIDNLKMPAMTMVFRVADPALLKDLNVGDAVRFHAENPAGKLTVTAIQKQ
ncbi:copper-binding protein [Aeromonas hydrophila]|uniref:copper-binding protein n=1 Tax=Aeromonas hydrophila TaxID=644 RepID=UPI0004D96017|nr:copper-binding protein [Aeromonas hydrophila]EJN6953693.1 copper-binding protein [Aeromonas hydrophila]KER62048.1 secretion protein HlyD [Aeromonas hydrophila]MCX4039138.1 copper-binding protein [Aeromonas hydrophila]OCA60528.1 secretion protein HlyD [Aeromonas hydrophila]OCY09934.1 secretion protein HlyD [Aeromonas hydrophila]